MGEGLMETSASQDKVTGKGHRRGPILQRRKTEETWVLGPCPLSRSHPFERPPETTEKGPSLTPWPQEPKPNQSCAASKKHGWGGLPSVLIPEPPRPARAPLCTPPSVFLLAPCHCANTQVFFGDGTRLTVVGKTCCRSSGPLAGTAGPRGAFQSGPILMC